MATLTVKQNSLYSELIKEYNEGWQNIVSLDRFIDIKIEAAQAQASRAGLAVNELYYNLQAVKTYAENDF